MPKQVYKMGGARRLLGGTLIVLFFAFSFNAYACLVPTSVITAAAMKGGCATPEEQPVYQFCDAFKTISVQSPDKVHFQSDAQSIDPNNTVSLGLLDLIASQNHRVSDHPPESPPRDLLLKISVLRI